MALRRSDLRAAQPAVVGVLPGGVQSAFAMDRTPGFLPGQAMLGFTQEARMAGQPQRRFHRDEAMQWPGQAQGRSERCAPGQGSVNWGSKVPGVLPGGRVSVAPAVGRKDCGSPTSGTKPSSCGDQRACTCIGCANASQQVSADLSSVLRDWRWLRGTPGDGPSGSWAPETSRALIEGVRHTIRIPRKRANLELAKSPRSLNHFADTTVSNRRGDWLNPGFIEPTSVERRVLSTLWVDTTGLEGNCDRFINLIELAIEFIQGHLEDLPDRIARNRAGRQPEECLSTTNSQRFGGIAQRYFTDLSPANIVDETMFSGNVRFRIDCKSGGGCDMAGQTLCGQWNDPIKDIHLCVHFLEAIQSSEALDEDEKAMRIACIIVHEIMHVWGADEQGASSVEVDSWQCV